MELMRLRPFGARRKTYFYGIASLVLAAHVVVGAIFHVMPPDLESSETIMPMEVQIVDRLLPDEVVESSAVNMVEDVGPEEEEPPPVFAPVWEGSPIVPEVEPIGPTETVLPEDVVVEEAPVTPDPPAADEVEPQSSQAAKPETKPVPSDPVSKPPVKSKPTPKKKTTSSKPPAKKKQASKPASKPPVKNEPVTPPATEPVDEPVKRAVPVKSSRSGRTGLLNRARNRAKQAESGPYVRATWSKRPPPFYPFEQRKRGIEGTAHVRVSIDSKGRITAARLVKSTGNAQLDQAALASVKKGAMNPATRGGRPVSSEMIVPFEFYD